jgi:hypothetical protein
LVIAARKCRSYFDFSAIWSHVKVLVSFLTVCATVDTQFGVLWPESFAKALDALSIMSLDLGILLSASCVVQTSFVVDLLCSTVLLIAIVGGILVGSKLRSKRMSSTAPERAQTIEQQGLFAAVYISVFAFPMVSTKIVAVFACHEVESIFYLRADYAMECYTGAWNGLAAYASVWVAVFVVGFPAWVLKTLWSYWKKVVPEEEMMLGFLLNDYCATTPMLLWEGVEMVRKLLLSTIGVFFPSKSTMCVSTALLISAAFLCLHCVCLPYKTASGNRLQSLCLVVLTLIYFIGVSGLQV